MKYIFFLAAGCLLFMEQVQAAWPQEPEKPNIHEIRRDIPKDLTAIFRNKVLDFFPIRSEFPEFFAEVEKQVPEQAELLEVYLPVSSKQDLERGHYDNILNLVYFYRMPQIMHKRIPLQKLQLAFVKESLEAVYNTFEKVDAPTLSDRAQWEETMYQNLLAGKNVYIRYKKTQGTLDYKYSLMLTLPLSDSHSIAAFMAHYPFLAEGQIYFLSSSSYLLDNNYYQVLRWTRGVLNDFIEVIPLEMFPDSDSE